MSLRAFKILPAVQLDASYFERRKTWNRYEVADRGITLPKSSQFNAYMEQHRSRR
jgi:hypothetical protein